MANRAEAKALPRRADRPGRLLCDEGGAPSPSPGRIRARWAERAFEAQPELASLRRTGPVVTGAGSGIGQAIVRQLAAEGATVVGCDVDAAGLALTLELTEKDGFSATFVMSDPDLRHGVHEDRRRDPR
ncbi:hypothetical protein Vlu01_03550 [Micromonospora lutea]|uniref:SDR family NAD(P)-dependent oxidoreductase n=1 Tax=Micromonospora lutea TaxID=419825 RepID=A0ABQ4IPL3_9ACTN|nr:hypothetical protein Vlu01_03550 [Micromonospora lutea]